MFWPNIYVCIYAKDTFSKIRVCPSIFPVYNDLYFDTKKTQSYNVHISTRPQTFDGKKKWKLANKYSRTFDQTEETSNKKNHEVTMCTQVLVLTAMCAIKNETCAIQKKRTFEKLKKKNSQSHNGHISTRPRRNLHICRGGCRHRLWYRFWKK